MRKAAADAEGPIPFNIPNITGKERAYIDEVFRAGVFAGNGEFTRRCQDLLQQRYGAPKVLLTHSCTAALELSALLLDLEGGDEVIIPSFTFCSTASAFARTRARIVFCDVDPKTMMIDVDDLKRRVTPRTRAIVPVHYGGNPCRIDEIVAIARDCGAVVVEDAAQGLDATLDGKPLGRFGALGCFSFHETKNLHAGLAGALFVNEEFSDRIDRAIQIWERGTNRQAFRDGQADKYTWTEIGSSFYPSELQAAFLLAQLETIDANTQARGRLYSIYEERLRPLTARGAFSLPEPSNRAGRNFHAFFLIMNSEEQSDDLRGFLGEHGVAAHFHFVPLHSSPVGQGWGWQAEDVPVTEAMAPRILRLPLHNAMSTQDLHRVCDMIEARLGR